MYFYVQVASVHLYHVQIIIMDTTLIIHCLQVLNLNTFAVYVDGCHWNSIIIVCTSVNIVAFHLLGFCV